MFFTRTLTPRIARLAPPEATSASVLAAAQSARHAPRQRGVTLIELAIVVAVLGVVTTSAAPGMVSMLDGRRLEGVATQLATDIHFTRSEAVARNLPLRLTLHIGPNASCYVVQTGLPAQCSCLSSENGTATCTGDAKPIKTVMLPADQKVSLQANVSSLLFDPLHGTATPAGTLKVLGAGDRAIHHVVNLMGRVRTCTPSGSVPAYRNC